MSEQHCGDGHVWPGYTGANLPPNGATCECGQRAWRRTNDFADAMQEPPPAASSPTLAEVLTDELFRATCEAACMATEQAEWWNRTNKGHKAAGDVFRAYVGVAVQPVIDALAADLDRVRREKDAVREQAQQLSEAADDLCHACEGDGEYLTLVNAVRFELEAVRACLADAPTHCDGNEHVWRLGETLCQCGRAAGEWGTR